ncbi:RagB/SusD family nutrient uptake outer membrane protein [Labilibaculum euxinus]
MKIILKNILLGFVLLLFSCQKEYTNPNEPSEESVYSSVDGFLSVCIGLKANYSTSALRYAIYVPGITAREIGTTSTYQTPMDLSYGGTSLTNINTGVGGLFSGLLQNKGQAEDLIENIDQVTMQDGTRNGVLAFAYYFKALDLCNLYQNFEQSPLMNSADGDAVFSNDSEVLDEAISLLLLAKENISGGMSDEFLAVIGDMEMEECCDALLSRLYLYSGEYDSCISVSSGINLTSQSTFTFDNENYNPVFAFAVDGSPYLFPKDNFGLVGAYLPDSDDGRYDFYLSEPNKTELEELGGDVLKSIGGFFSTFDTPIPVYLPGEILLNMSEAYARDNDLANAVIYLNMVMTKTDDVFGVNAGLPDQTSFLTSLSKDDLLEEIYKNRCVELFFTGQRLVDSRRFHPNLVFTKSSDLESERNRNYYPYPQEERDNNPNCPADPEI